MPDEPNVTQPTLPAAIETLGNDPAARNPDGTIKDPALTTSATSTTESKTEPKPAEAKPADAKPPAEGVPEKYEFKAPEGYEIDPKFAEEASGVFKDLGLTQAQATKLTEMYTAKVLEASNAPMKAYEDMRATWRNEVVSDKDLGNGKDDIRPEVKASIATAIDSLPPKVAESFREAMTMTGAGDNPAFIRAFYELSKTFNEGKPVTAGKPAPVTRPGAPASPAQAMYPNLPSSSAS